MVRYVSHRSCSLGQAVSPSFPRSPAWIARSSETYRICVAQTYFFKKINSSKSMFFFLVYLVIVLIPSTFLFMGIELKKTKLCSYIYHHVFVYHYTFSNNNKNLFFENVSKLNKYLLIMMW